MHEVAQQGFDAAAGDYEAARPGYPPDAVAWFVDHLGLHAGSRCADLAAGTGKFTRELVRSGADVIAVEPVAGMRDLLREALPSVAVVSGLAEALPLARASVDAVTIAQAFHWFDAERALAELARVVRPGGNVGIVWNARDRDHDWVDRLWSVMDRVEKRAPWRDHEHWRDSVLRDRPEFGDLVSAEFRHTQEITVAGVLQRFASVSHVAVLDEAERAAVLAEIAEILATHPDTAGRDLVAIPYRVDCYCLHRS